MITTGAANDDTYKQDYTHVCQLYTPGSFYLKSTVDVIKSFNPNAKIAVLHEVESFTESVVKGLVSYAELQGFEIVLQESYASDTADLRYNVDFSVSGIQIGSTTLLGTRLAAAFIASLFTGGLYLFLYRTRPGKFIRAVV